MIKIIKEFPNYSIQTNGNICNRKYGHSLKHCNNGTGYKIVYLMGPDGKRKGKLVHRLLLEAFVGDCPIGMETCHNNGNKLDNRLDNLRWDTKKNNENDKLKHGTRSLGENHQWAKLTEQDVQMIIYMWSTGLFTQYEIAEVYNIDHANVSAIVLKKSWKHLWEKKK